MGFFYWDTPPKHRNQQTTDTPKRRGRHERAHEAAGRGEGLSGYWWKDRDGNPRYANNESGGSDSSRKLALVQIAGCLSGADPGDFDGSDQDWRDAQMLAREAKVPIADLVAEVQRKGYVR